MKHFPKTLQITLLMIWMNQIHKITNLNYHSEAAKIVFQLSFQLNDNQPPIAVGLTVKLSMDTIRRQILIS